jgi:hypothetical protein
VLPPRWVRRLAGPLLLAALVGAVTALPLLVVVAAAVSAWLPGRWRALRLLWFALVYLTLELVGMVLAFGLWVASGFGRQLEAPGYQAAHYAVLRVLLDLLMIVARRLFKLRLVTDGASWSPLDDGVPGSTNAMVVLSRHAGPGDSFLLVHTLMDRDHLRRPRIVLKDTLQLDPLIDVFLNRLPNRFISPGPRAGQAGVAGVAPKAAVAPKTPKAREVVVDVAAAIGDLASGLGEEDALLVFPEGGNFTPRRRFRAIERLRHRGLVRAARQAEAMLHVLPPRPGGVGAALAAAPHADVVFVAHTGLEHLSTLRDVWRGLPMDKTLHLRWWFVPAAEVPREAAEQVDWLYRWWARIDEWIAATPERVRRVTP